MEKEEEESSAEVDSKDEIKSVTEEEEEASGVLSNVSVCELQWLGLLEKEEKGEEKEEEREEKGEEREEKEEVRARRQWQTPR